MKEKQMSHLDYLYEKNQMSHLDYLYERKTAVPYNERTQMNPFNKSTYAPL